MLLLVIMTLAKNLPGLVSFDFCVIECTYSKRFLRAQMYKSECMSQEIYFKTNQHFAYDV